MPKRPVVITTQVHLTKYGFRGFHGFIRMISQLSYKLKTMRSRFKYSCISEPLVIKQECSTTVVLGNNIFLSNNVCDGKCHGKITAFADDAALAYSVIKPFNKQMYDAKAN